MVFYVKQGELPESRHTYISRSKLYREELFGEEGFDGPYSLLYHIGEPTRVKEVSRADKAQTLVSNSEELLHRHFETSELKRSGDFVTGRQYILFNDSVLMGFIRPENEMKDLFRHALRDQLFFVHSGTGVIHSVLGDITFGKGDYLYVPKGTTYKVDYSDDSEFFFVESADRITIPKRYLNTYGQLKEGSPYYTRDIHIPELKRGNNDPGTFTVLVDFDSYYIREERDRNPFDVVGWDGYLYPFSINVDLMAPIVGKLHQPPPVHETFSGNGFMVGTFLPRKYDFHPNSIPISYYHSNIDTDEVLFYSSGSFMSRKGINPGSITLHVRGLIHGPQPGAIENALGKEGTDEVAVMVEAYKPLKVTETASSIEDKKYMSSWYR